MGSEKSCQNCHQSFWIEPEDFEFYEKIKVPPPTWCPECRLRRRLIWNNTRNLYWRSLTDTGASAISMYSQDKPLTVIEDKKWWSDAWDPLEYGQEVNFSKPFLQQFHELMRRVPFPHLQREYSTMTNSDYCNAAAELRNCYLVENADNLENCAYSHVIQNSRDCMDTSFVFRSELCYGGVNLIQCYRVLFSLDCEGCRDVYFSRDCVDCNDCFGCVNLRKKSYHIFNQPYSREQYFERLKELGLDSRTGLKHLEVAAKEHSSKYPSRFMHGRLNTNVSGEYIYESRNVTQVYDVQKSEDCRYCHFLKCVPTGTTDSYDYSVFGNTASRMYESTWCGLQVSNLKFCFWNYGSQDMEYSIACHGSRDLFGCVGLRKKQYCILNKQYSKETYNELVHRIIQHMNEIPYTDQKGRVYRYGEFFPPEFSPFGYNETFAYDYFPIHREQALSEGYSWKGPEAKSYEITMPFSELPDRINTVSDAILSEVIECEHEGKCEDRCSTAFRIIPQELAFYRKMNLPLPRLCPNCRHYQRIKQRNPLKLWHRTCQCAGQKSDTGVYTNQSAHFHGSNHCPNEFETSYSPDRKEIVYCEQCYQAEVV